ncbi:MAG: Crp/Fnr family transcriptional regulator [Saprospiraceae bacterium]|nr:Crp/Fnr family transcriptional regulator [Saprospiraceae bacterium]
MNELQKLKQAFAQLNHIPDKEWDAFSKIWEKIDVKRKVNITAEGQIERYTYFVIDGIQRIYYLDDAGKEATIVFTYEGDFGGVLDSYLLQTPSKYYYETLSKSVLLRCKKDDFDRLQLQYESIKLAIDKALYLGFSGTMARLVELQILSSEEKFKKLLQRSPHILHKIPHKYLANYIGIDPTNFSKLLNNVKL